MLCHQGHYFKSVGSVLSHALTRLSNADALISWCQAVMGHLLAKMRSASEDKASLEGTHLCQRDISSFTEKVLRHWHRLPEKLWIEAVDVLFLEAFKARLDRALGNLI